MAGGRKPFAARGDHDTTGLGGQRVEVGVRNWRVSAIEGLVGGVIRDEAEVAVVDLARCGNAVVVGGLVLSKVGVMPGRSVRDVLERIVVLGVIQVRHRVVIVVVIVRIVGVSRRLTLAGILK